MGWTPAYVAALNGYLDVLQFFNEHHVPLNVPNSWGENSAYVAALNGYLDILEYLSSCAVPLNVANTRGETLAHAAALNGYLDVIEFLHAQKAPLGQRNRKGQTPLEYAAYRGHLELVTFLIQHIPAKEFNMSKLAFAAARGGNVDILDYLKQCGLDIHATLKDGRNIVFAAAESGEMCVLDYCVENQISFKIKDKKGLSAEDVAIKRQHWALAEAIRENIGT
eukprot:GFYU01009094.1.p1 GENE.GFYU01009094.1~~GFYU01009094.1.p1  ORF type:complete len:245 (-),score=55.10 GFYU01009094.1:152-820(-)